MTIGTMDIYLLVIIVAALVLGFFWGAVRSLMLLAAGLLAFVTGAYLQLQLGSYLAGQWTDYAAGFSEMAAFALIYLGMLAGGALHHRRLDSGLSAVSSPTRPWTTWWVRSWPCAQPSWASPA